MDSFIIENIDDIKLKQNMTLADIVVQLQSFCEKLLCIKIKDNKETLHYYEKKEYLPKNLIYKSHSNNFYHFNDEEYHYVVFGLSAAKLICPSLSIESQKTLISPFLKPISETIDENYVILYDNGNKYIFPYGKQEIVITTINVFDN